MSPDERIDAFVSGCLARVDVLQRQTVQIVEDLETKLSEREAEIARLASLAGVAHLAAAANRGPSARESNLEATVARLEAQVSRQAEALSLQESEIRGYKGQIESLEEELDSDPDERVAELRETIARLETEKAEAEAEAKSYHEEAEDLATKVEELEDEKEKRLPDSWGLAIAVHDFLRSAKLLPESLDAPLRIAPHAYRVGLEGALLNELPEE